MSRNRILALATVAAALTSSGWLYAWKQAGPQRFVQSMERHSSRVLYFGNGGIAGQYAVETGQPVWKEQYAAQIKNSAQVPDGRRVRMGNNFWSTIETTIDLEIGGAALPVGYYYLCYEKAGDGVNLVAFDANELRGKNIASFQPPQEGGIVIPMTMAEGDDEEDVLTADFVVDNGSGAVTLEVAWGPFTLSAPVEGAPRD